MVNFVSWKKKINEGTKKKKKKKSRWWEGGRGKVNNLRFPNRVTGCKGRERKGWLRHYLFGESWFH